MVKGANTLDELDRIKEEERRASGSRDIPFDPITGLEDLSTELSEAQWANLLGPASAFSIPEEASHS